MPFVPSFSLPLELLLIIASFLEPSDLLSMVQAIPNLAQAAIITRTTLRDQDGNTILHLLAMEGRCNLLACLLRSNKGITDLINTAGQTPLLLGAMCGHLTTLRLLISQISVDPNVADNLGRTAMTWVADQGSEAMVRFLLA